SNRMREEELLKRAGSGDETAFLLLYERHRDLIFRFAYRMLGSLEQATDVTHDCFLYLIDQPERFDPTRASLRTYLYAMARNLVFKRFRKQGIEIAIDELPEEYCISNSREPLGKLIDEELSLEVRKAIADLPPLQREVLILFEYEELSLAKIAEIVEAD